jgi:hypothetical protein
MAQSSLGLGYSGSVVLQDKKVVLGKISVYPQHDLVVLKDSTGITVLPAYKIESVFYFDSAANLNRRYISWHDQESPFAHHRLFEVVVMGKISVVRRPMSGSGKSDNALNFNYFLLYKGAIIELQKFKRLVYPDLISRSNELEVFVKRERLNPNLSGNAIRIIQQFNQVDHYVGLALN